MVLQIHLEILTVKSDDVIGRAKTYDNRKKETMPEPGLPESSTYMHELKGLGLDIRLEE